MTRRVGVIGSLVWNDIRGRDPLVAVTHEWGGIAYALAAFDAALPDDWELVPLVAVGRDLASEATDFLRTLRRPHRGARFIEVPEATHRVTLHYHQGERFSDAIQGGIPGWRWSDLGPMVADLDALYLNFNVGHELPIETARALRHGFQGPIYADLHSLSIAAPPPHPDPTLPDWWSLFDAIQCNEVEFARLGISLVDGGTRAVAAGVSLLTVTRGAAGAVYFARPGFNGCWRPTTPSGAMRTAQMASLPVAVDDPTGCGDVFGATAWARLLAGDDLTTALTAATRAAARNATFRGATHLADLLRGLLVLT